MRPGADIHSALRTRAHQTRSLATSAPATVPIAAQIVNPNTASAQKWNSENKGRPTKTGTEVRTAKAKGQTKRGLGRRMAAATTTVRKAQTAPHGATRMTEKSM